MALTPLHDKQLPGKARPRIFITSEELIISHRSSFHLETAQLRNHFYNVRGKGRKVIAHFADEETGQQKLNQSKTQNCLVQELGLVTSTANCMDSNAILIVFLCKNIHDRDFCGGPGVENPPANAGAEGSVSGPGRFHMLRSN